MRAEWVNPEDFRKLISELKKVGENIGDPNMQLYRANRYRQFTIGLVKNGQAFGLHGHISGATKIIDKKDHNPEWNTGELLESMKVKPVGKNAADVGYFANDTRQIKGKDKTVTQIAILQHTGFRVPLFGDEGRKVMAFLFRAGVLNSIPKGERSKTKSEKWMIIPPRPFMFNSLEIYESSGEDIRACDEFLNKMTGKGA